MTQSIDLKSFENHLLVHGVEFAGIIDKRGRVIDHVCKNEINLSKEQKEMFFMSTTLNLSMQSDYDDNFGSVQYTITERENSKIVSIPAPMGSIILVTDKKVRVSLIVKKIVKAIDYIKGLNNKSAEPEKSKILEEIKI
jgi:predicted regulator of Ras-like GTPase activity (Roadblock/LC7/MglB family)